MPTALITYCGETAKVICDGKCHKAWGMNDRPKIQLSENEDDHAYLADSELGEAPDDPGTTEGFERKPKSIESFPNRWCVRQCERCRMSDINQWKEPLEMPDFSKRFYNFSPHYRD